MQPRLAIAWVLLLLVGLLIGLLVMVLAVGVSRHVRRLRHRSKADPNPTTRPASSTNSEYDEDLPGPGRRPFGGTTDDED